MKRLVVELTDRCNLRCTHCYSGRHGAKHELDLPRYLALLPEAKANGITEISFTGGEPTLCSWFAEAVAQTVAQGLRFSLVSNGWTFARTLEVIERHRAAFDGITFSMDGATDAVHDRQRGRDSFRRLMESIVSCREAGLPFTLNFVVTARSRHELAEAAALAEQLGARGIRFIAFIPTDQADCDDLDLPLAGWDAVLAELLALKAHAPIAIGLSPGFPSSALLPCHSLAGTELNLDWRGQLGLCCHLSGMVPTPKTTKLADVLVTQTYPAMHAGVEAQRQQILQRRLRAPGASQLTGQSRLACRDCMKQLNLLPTAPSPSPTSLHHALETG